ncbi:MAG: hypothetical protein K0R37_862 [Arthrobacter sp.]|nr:hypothetical protein [Arthrobacter sp.]
MRVDPEHGAAGAEGRILRSAGERGHIQPAVRADGDVGGHRLEPVGVPHDAGRHLQGSRLGGGDPVWACRQHGDGFGLAGFHIDGHDAVGARVSHVHLRACNLDAVRVGIDVALVGDRHVLRQLSGAGRRQVAEAVLDAAVGVFFLLQGSQITKHAVLAVGIDAVDVSGQWPGIHRAGSLAGGEEDGAPLPVRTRHIPCSVFVDYRAGSVAGDPHQAARELFADENRTVVPDAEVQGSNQALRKHFLGGGLGSRGGLGGRRGRKDGRCGGKNGQDCWFVFHTVSNVNGDHPEH